VERSEQGQAGCDAAWAMPPWPTCGEVNGGLSSSRFKKRRPGYHLLPPLGDGVGQVGQQAVNDVDRVLTHDIL